MMKGNYKFTPYQEFISQPIEEKTRPQVFHTLILLPKSMTFCRIGRVCCPCEDVNSVSLDDSFSNLSAHSKDSHKSISGPIRNLVK